MPLPISLIVVLGIVAGAWLVVTGTIKLRVPGRRQPGARRTLSEDLRRRLDRPGERDWRLRRRSSIRAFRTLSVRCEPTLRRVREASGSDPDDPRVRSSIDELSAASGRFREP